MCYCDYSFARLITKIEQNEMRQSKIICFLKQDMHINQCKNTEVMSGFSRRLSPSINVLESIILWVMIFISRDFPTDKT